MIVDELIELLETLGYPVYQQGSMSAEDPFPTTFVTFWEYPEDEDSYYDNREHRVVYDFAVNCYSSNPAEPYDVIDSARDLLKDNGWIVKKRSFSLETDEPTYTGRGFEAVYCDYM